VLADERTRGELRQPRPVRESEAERRDVRPQGVVGLGRSATFCGFASIRVAPSRYGTRTIASELAM
jgi:hypothetical protein